MTTPWPRYADPADLDRIEAVALADRDLPASTYEGLVRTATANPDGLALIVMPDGATWSTPVRVTFGELLADVRQRANALVGLGIGRDDAVAVLAPNCAELVPTILGAQAAGIVAPINPVLQPDHVRMLVRRSRARVLVAAGPELDPTTWQAARAVAAASRVRALLALRPTGAEGDPAPLEPIEGVLVDHFAALSATSDRDRLRATPPGADDIAAYFHTGGTTGTPKLAAHTQRGEIVDAWSVATISTTSDEATVLAALPLFHVNALVVTTLAPMLRGQTVVWAGPLGFRDPGLARSFWRIVEAYRVTSMSAVPSVYAGLTAVPVDADISSLELCIVGAAPLPAHVRERWLAHTGVPLSEGYGLTEATCASARSFPDIERPDSVGQRMPYQSISAVRIDPETGEWHDLPPGQTGTLVIGGPTVFAGYLVEDDDGSVRLDDLGRIRGGRLDTGDLGSVDSDGFVRLAGRATDVIIRGGHNIDPSTVEASVLSHPAVLDAGAVGRPDRRSGEVPVVYVVTDGTVGSDALLSWAAEHVAEPAAAPKSVTIVDALPHTAVGKPYRLGLRLDATAQELTEALSGIGVVVPTGDRWCRQEDGVVVVELPRPADAREAAAVEGVLSEYALAWSFVG